MDFSDRNFSGEPTALPDSSAGDLDELHLSAIDAVVQLSFVTQGLLERAAAAHGLSTVQLRLLGILRDRTPTMNELAKFLELDKSSVTGLINRAEVRELVRRESVPEDHRSTRVSLGKRGQELIRTALKDLQGQLRDFLKPLDESDRARLTALTARILTARALPHGLRLAPPKNTDGTTNSTVDAMTNPATSVTRKPRRH